MNKEQILSLLEQLRSALEDSKNVSKGQYPEGAEQLLADSAEQIQAYREQEDDELQLDATADDAREYINGLDDDERTQFFAEYGHATGERLEGSTDERFQDEAGVVEYLQGLNEAQRESLLAGFRAPVAPGQESQVGEAAFWVVGNATFNHKPDAERYIRTHGMSGSPRPLGYLR